MIHTGSRFADGCRVFTHPPDPSLIRAGGELPTPLTPSLMTSGRGKTLRRETSNVFKTKYKKTRSLILFNEDSDEII